MKTHVVSVTPYLLFSKIQLLLQALDLLDKLLQWLPSDRISAEAAMEHEFVQPYRVVEGETALPGRFNDPNSGAVLTPNQWRDIITKEIKG